MAEYLGAKTWLLIALEAARVFEKAQIGPGSCCSPYTSHIHPLYTPYTFPTRIHPLYTPYTPPIHPLYTPHTSSIAS